jgi:hypothetical protein
MDSKMSEGGIPKEILPSGYRLSLVWSGGRVDEIAVLPVSHGKDPGKTPEMLVMTD